VVPAAEAHVFWHVVSLAAQLLRQFARVVHFWLFMQALTSLAHWPPEACAVSAQAWQPSPASPEPASLGGVGEPASSPPDELEQSAAHWLPQAAALQMQLPTASYSLTADVPAAEAQLFWHVVSLAAQLLMQLMSVAHALSFEQADTESAHAPFESCAAFAQVVHGSLGGVEPASLDGFEGFEGFDGLEGFEGFEGLVGLEGFEGLDVPVGGALVIPPAQPATALCSDVQESLVNVRFPFEQVKPAFAAHCKKL